MLTGVYIYIYMSSSLGFFHRSISRDYRMVGKEENIQFSGWKCLVDVRGEWPDCFKLIES